MKEPLILIPPHSILANLGKVGTTTLVGCKRRSTMKQLVLTAMLMAFPYMLSADSGDDTLLHLMKKSDAVISAEIIEMSGPTSDESGAAMYHLECRNFAVLHGKSPAGDKLPVFVTHPELEATDRLPMLAKGTRCILFLKREDRGKTGEFWKDADVWNSVQPYNSFMSRRVKQLSKELAKAKCDAFVGGQPGNPDHATTNPVTAEFLSSRGFVLSDAETSIYTLANVTVGEAAKRLGFSPEQMEPTRNQSINSDIRTVKVRNLRFVISSEVRDSQGNIVNGSLDKPDALCTVSVALAQLPETSMTPKPKPLPAEAIPLRVAKDELKTRGQSLHDRLDYRVVEKDWGWIVTVGNLSGRQPKGQAYFPGDAVLMRINKEGKVIEYAHVP